MRSKPGLGVHVEQGGRQERSTSDFGWDGCALCATDSELTVEVAAEEGPLSTRSANWSSAMSRAAAKGTTSRLPGELPRA